MRQIKFRAWIKEIEGEKGYMVLHDNPDLNYSEAIDPHNKNGSIILMQFTGLKDRNGVDVYEGDILKWKCSKSGSNKEKEHIVTIEWDSYHYSLTIYDNKEKWATQRSFWNASDRELIGNIYEHPNLLTNE